MSKLIRTDLVYKEWIQDVSRRFRRSQLKAAVKVNDEMLRFYWSLGQDISRMNKDARYGTEFYKTISRDLKDIFPDVHSFSPTNLKYMRYFYEMYPDVTNRQQLVDDFKTAENRQQAADDLGKEIIFYIPWGHHMVLLDKMKGNPEKAMFYIRKTLENNWSRTVLLNFVDTNLYERQGKAVTNFAQTPPAPQSELAQDITRDPYNFDFLTIREKYDEKELKNALMDKVENFLTELGTGFAFMGREVRLEVGNKEKYLESKTQNLIQINDCPLRGVA